MKRMRAIPTRPCACGCGERVPVRVQGRPRRYHSRACAARGRSRESRQAAGREGGVARARAWEGRLLDELLALPKEQAILAAYERGRRAAYRRYDRALAQLKARDGRAA